ncbi:MAG: GGDEF domain-containing protein [Oscillospiraceae bacterium]|nr:GGDEF domain-containing protein [Oscillospiraceae bacterium]
MNSTEKKAFTSGSNSNEVAILFENFLCVSKFNVMTGEYRMIKSYQDNRNSGAESCDTIYSYFRQAVESGMIHPDDRELILRYMEPEYLADRLFRGTAGRRLIIHGLRYRLFGEYRSVSMDIFAPRNFSDKAPWTAFCVRADGRTSPDATAVSRIASNYYKILYINLESGLYEPVFMLESEIGSEESLPLLFWDWMRQFACCGNVPNEELEDFLLFTDPEYVRIWLRENDGEYKYRYNRRVGTDYLPAVMKFVRSQSYSEDNPSVYGYICIDDPEGKHSLERRAIEKYFSSIDIMTGMWNRSRFELLCREYSDCFAKKIVEVLYAKLNDVFSDEEDGRLTADQAIRTFAFLMTDTFGRDKCYRIGENELAVIFVGGAGDTFSRRAEQFCSRVEDSEFNYAFLAYISDKGSETVDAAIDKARRKASGVNV